MKEAQIILYGILNLYNKAVKLALSCKNIELAQQYANKPEDVKTKKKLWMRIAKQLFDNSITSTKKAAMVIAAGGGGTKGNMSVEDALAIIRD
jgi:putative intracellular protease/amidase